MGVHMNKKYKLKRIVWIYINEIIFLFLIIVSVVKIYIWYSENKENNEVRDIIENSIEVDESKDIYKIDFEELKSKNSDIVAWIKVCNTNIEYPIVKSSNNEFYLNHNFYKQKNKAGWVFANYLNRFDGTDKNISLFAHARIDGSMFGTLKKTLSSEWQNNEDNLKIIFVTENEISKYQVFSTYRIKEENYYIKSSFINDKEYERFIKNMKLRSNYNYNIKVTKEDRILTLSTCDVDDRYRIVLHAKKIN